MDNRTLYAGPQRYKPEADRRYGGRWSTRDRVTAQRDAPVQKARELVDRAVRLVARARGREPALAWLEAQCARWRERGCA